MQTKALKILHVFDHSIPLHSGYTFRSRAILEHQRDMGWETFHITSAKHTVAEKDVEEIDGLKFYRTRPAGGLMERIPILNQWSIISSLESRLNEIIPDIKPDIIHAHSPALNGLAALKAANKHNIPLVYECRAFWEDAAVDHGTTREGSVRYRLTRLLETYVFKKANAVTCICNGLKNDIANRGVNDKKITIIPNAVDIQKFKFDQEADSSLKKTLGLDNQIVLGFIGSFYAYEGIPLILDALPEILKNKSNVKFLLVGGGPQEENIKARIEQLQLQDSVVMTGRVPHDQVQDYYNLVDIFLYPRLSMRLTDLVTPLKPLEAMAQGRLVIASDVGGHKELITNHKNGVLFQANQVTSLVTSVIELIEHSDQWSGMKQEGKRYVEDERNWKKSVGNYRDVYTSIIDEAN